MENERTKQIRSIIRDIEKIIDDEWVSLECGQGKTVELNHNDLKSLTEELRQANERLADAEMTASETALTDILGKQINGAITCPRECVIGQNLVTLGDFPGRLFCPHCNVHARITVHAQGVEYER